MIKYLSFALPVVALAVFVLPTNVQAAVPGLSEIKSSLKAEKLAVFTASDTLAVSSQTVQLPVWGATSAVPHTFTYSVTHGSTSVPSIGFAVSDAPIVDGMYQFGPNERASFTLIMLAPLPYLGATLEDFSVEVTNWPITKVAN